MIVLRARFLCSTLIGLGLAVSGYLLVRHLALAGASDHSGVDVCSALFGTGCDAALRSPASVQLGLPLAGWGLLYYITLASLLFLAWYLGESFEFEATLGALLLAIVGVVISVPLFVAMLAGQLPFCPLCAAAHVINSILVFPLKRLAGLPISKVLQALASGGRYLAGAEPADSVQARWKVVGFLTVALVAVVTYQWVLIEATRLEQPGETPFDPQQLLAAYESGVEQQIEVDARDPRIGPTHAPAQLVLFSDFQCPACRSFSHRVEYLAEEFEGELQIIFKHFPLGLDCNPLMETDLHPQACEAAWAASAAQRQGRFWPFHDALFSSDLGDGQTTVSTMAREVGLDLEQFEGHRTGEAVKAKVRSDIDLGFQLGVDATPSIFLNGRRVYDLRENSLEVLIVNVAGKRP